MTLDQLKELLPQLSSAMLRAMGETGVKLVRSQMLHGYARPVYDTGALVADVQVCEVDDRTIQIGSTLPYAPPVHDGTMRVAPRPYLTDALANGEALRMAAAEALHEWL